MPVVAADGHSYGKTVIEKWLAKNDTSPLTVILCATRLCLDPASSTMTLSAAQLLAAAPHANECSAHCTCMFRATCQCGSASVTSK